MSSEPAQKKAKTSSDADNTYPVIDRVASGAHVRGMAAYNKMYQRSINENEAFWADMAHQQLTFSQDFTSVRDGGFEEGDVRWFSGGKLNVSYNCIDRHVESECCRFPSFPFLDPLFAGEYSPAAELWRDHAFVVAFFAVFALRGRFPGRKKHSCSPS